MKCMKYMVAILACAGVANATIIQPTAVISEEYAVNEGAISMIDNARMNTAVNHGDSLASALAATHEYGAIYDGFYNSSAWGYPSDFFATLPANNGGDTDVDFVLDLGSDQTLGSILLWQNSNNGGGADLVGNHARTIEIRVNTAAQGSGAFAGAATTVTLKPVTDGDADAGNDLGGVNSAQGFALDALTSGRYVQLSITDNYYDAQGMSLSSGDRVGLSEVRFASEVIPEPATFGLMAVFGGAVLFIRRKLTI